MKKLFQDIRHNDVDAVRTAIAKNPNVVNEYFDGKAPKKDIGQSPLQVAVKCGQFEIIDLLLENGADPDFMEDPAIVPPNSICMSVLHDAIIGAMDTLLYGEYYEDSEKYVRLIEVLLEKGADPNKETCSKDFPQIANPPVSTLIIHATENLGRYGRFHYSHDAALFEASKKNLFEILDLLKKYGADFDKWLDSDPRRTGRTFRKNYLDDFVPEGNEPYGEKEIRAALQEYFKYR